jgi:transketolase
MKKGWRVQTLVQKYPEMKKLWDTYFSENIPDLLNNDAFWAYADKPDATRSLSGIMINRIKDILPNFIGGSADLAPSNKTNMKDAGDFAKESYEGRNIHFGVRELAMAAIGNGLALHGGLKTFVATFFVFSDYVKPMARLTSLMGLPVTYVFTHDSIGVGEDGPTHEPIEQLAMLRSMPNFTVFRPADATETAAAWYYAITSKNTPTALVLSRQNLPQLSGSSKEALKGGYVLLDSSKKVPDGILIASGSEVELAVNAKAELAKEGIDVRVVSMPSMDIFEAQTAAYKENVLPKAVRKRVVVEAATDFGWGKYVGLDGGYVTMKGFGASAPAKTLFKKFGFTTENVVDTFKKL